VGEQERLLELARPYIESGRVHSLRLSTRPDAIEPGHLVWLKTRGVGTIELGAQSFDDRVLAAVQRGHTAAQTIEAARAVKDAGLELGLQLMCGLPGETRRSFTQSCRQAAMLRPSLVRIYPLLVLRGTALARDYEAGRFQPLSLGEAVSWCQEALALFEAAAIPVARMGLQSAPGLEASILAGPYHPAFGQLVRQALSGSKRHPKEVLSLNG
jgi:histone acetyltransferase (RNA polymerase elongator complex component)